VLGTLPAWWCPVKDTGNNPVDMAEAVSRHISFEGKKMYQNYLLSMTSRIEK
jgi:hypothetical protein